jgi:hypothetical protein
LDAVRSPNEELAFLIVEKLVVQGLVQTSAQSEIEFKIATGSAKAEDWKLWAEQLLFLKEVSDDEAD